MQAKRRSFTAKYEARILAEADARTRPGEVGELLRGEGLYTSHLTHWRKQRKDGALKLVRAGGGHSAVAILTRLYSSPRCASCPDSISCTTAGLGRVAGRRQVTDAHLASLAASRDCRLATFDRSIKASLKCFPTRPN